MTNDGKCDIINYKIKRKGLDAGTTSNRIDTKVLINILKMTQREVRDFMCDELRRFGYMPIKADGFVYAEGSINIGLVAHMDTVHDEPKYIEYANGEMTCRTGLGADDRAGVYGILHLLRQGFRPTVMLLEDEEKGCIGAGKFAKVKIEHKLKYLIELDRQGSDDAVFYDCDNPEFTKYVCEFGFKEAIGSFSDISDIAPAMGISAVNLSVGYYLQHTKSEYLVIGELSNTLRRVAKMLSKEPKNTFKYVERDWKANYYSKYSKYYTKGGITSGVWYRDDYENEYDYGYGSKKSETSTRTPITLNGKEVYWNGYYFEDENGAYYDESEVIVPYTNQEEDYIPLYDGILLFGNGDMVDLALTSKLYYIGVDDNIYNEYTIKIDAYLTDENFMPLSYADVYERSGK